MTSATQIPVATAGDEPLLLVRRLALLVAVAFVLVGVAGFVPGITTHFGDLTFAGHESGAKLFGVFQVSILHNLVHLVFGVVGLALARTVAGARLFLIGGGAVYLAFWVYGFAVGHHSAANFVPFDAADNWLHLGLGLGMMILGLGSGERR